MKERVLLVDDSEELLDVYREGLEAAGYVVDTAISGEVALDIAKSARPDIVITDVCMPGMSGLELITHIRSDLPPPVPRLLVLSGFARVESEAMERGAERFLLKPLGLGDLVKSVGEVVAGRAPGDSEMRRDQVQCRAQVRSLSHAAYEATFRDPLILSRTARVTRWLSAYLGHSAALVLAPRNGAMEVVVSSDRARFPCGQISDELLSLSGDVLESGSRLVLTDVAASKAFLNHGSPKVRFLVCIPFVISEIPIAVLCLADDQPHSFDSTELSILEGIATTTTATLVRPHAPRWSHDSGLFSLQALALLLAKGTEWAADRGACSGLLLVKTAGLPPGDACGAMVDELSSRRMSIGAISDDTLAVFVSDTASSAVTSRLDAARAGVGAHISELASSRLTFEAPIPRLSPDALLAWGLELLACAETTRPSSSVVVDCRVSEARTRS